MKNTYSICTTFLLLIYYQWSYSQSWLWAKSFGSDKMDYGSQVMITKDGNILTHGDFVGLNLILPDSTIVGNTNASAFIAKYNQAGNLLKITICKGAPNGGGDAELGRFAEDEAGNLYMAGSSAGGAWFDTCWLVSGGGGNGCIAKFNSDLRCLWIQKHSTGSVEGQGFGDTRYYNGSLYLAGTVTGINNYIDTFYVTNNNGPLSAKDFLARFDTTAKAKIVKQTWGGAASLLLFGINNSKMYLRGGSDSCFIFDTIHQCNFRGDILFQTDTNGNIIWSKNFTGASVRILNVTNTGEFYTTGSFGDSLKIDNQQFYKTQGATVDGYIAKFSSSGNMLWLKQITNSNLTYMKGIYTDNSNRTYICGQFIGTSNFGNGVTLTSTYNNKYDMFIARYDASGNCMGAFQQHGVSPTNITQDSAANPIVVGYVYPDSAVLGDIHLVSKGQQDFFIGKLSAITGSSSSKTIEPDGFLNIYANPNAGLFTIEVPQAVQNNNAQLQIYGPLGELVKDEPTDISNSRVSVNLGEVVRGIYSVVLQSGNKRFTGRVVVE
jgi:hypothetical protein